MKGAVKMAVSKESVAETLKKGVAYIGGCPLVQHCR